MCYFEVPLESYNLLWHKTSLLQSCCLGSCLLDETLSLVPTVAVVENKVLDLALFCMVILVPSLLILLLTGPYFFSSQYFTVQFQYKNILKPKNC